MLTSIAGLPEVEKVDMSAVENDISALQSQMTITASEISSKIGVTEVITTSDGIAINIKDGLIVKIEKEEK